MLPQIVELEFETDLLPSDIPPIGKNYLYDFEAGEFVLVDGKLVEVTGVESLKVWIEKTLMTQEGRFKIYEDTGYGTNYEDLIGSSMPRAFIEAEIKRETTTPLLLNPNILAIENWTFERDGKRMFIRFRVRTTEDTFEQGVSI